MRKLWFFLYQEKLWTLLCLVIMVMSSVFTILQAGFIANMVSFTTNLDQAKQLPQVSLGDGRVGEKIIHVFRLLIDGDNLEATRYIIVHKDYTFYAILGLVSILFIAFIQILFFLRDFSNQYYTFRISAKIRQQFYNKALDYKFLHLKDRQSGDLISRALSDIKLVESDIYPLIESLVYGPIVLIFGLVSMFIINIQFTFILFFSFLILGLVIFFISSFFKRLVSLTQERLSDITVHIKNSLENIDVIKIFTRQSYEKIRFAEIVCHHLNLLKRSVFIHYMNRPLGEIFIASGGLFIIFYSSGLILNDEISITELFTFFSILLYVAPYVQRINNGFFLKQRVGVAMNRLFDPVDSKNAEKSEGRELNDALREKGCPLFQGSLEFRNIGFHYLQGKPVLKDVSFTAQKGEFVAIVGESGSGKSTLLNMIPLFIIPDQGEIFFDGMPSKELALDGVRKHIAFVPQESVLFPVSIRENILYGNLEADEEAIVEAARLANIHEVVESLPQGYDTLVGDQGSKLSVGQKQRLAIARALIKNPRILILDEATSALDSISENLIQESLKNNFQDRTIIAIAHRLTTVLEASKIMVMESGRMVGIGTHRELLSNNSVYQRLYHNQFQQL